MTRHARNCTAGAVYTYHEKKKDAEASGYGTQNQRVGKDSVKDYDCCCLTLQPCRDPMITKDGYLFDKEAILEYIIRKKNEISRKMKEYEKQKKKEETELADLAAAEKESKLNRFVKSEKNIVSAPIEAFRKENPNAKPSVSNMAEGRDKVLPSFWIPSKTPAAKSSTIEKPPSSGGVFDDDEDFYDKGASTLHIPEDVMKAIDQVIPSSDPLDDPEFNPVNYIDAIFPTEQSLSNIDDVIAQLECKIHNIDDQIGTVIRVQTSVGKDGRDALADAQRVIRQLFLQTLEIKTRAEQSEGTVKDIMGDIKQLDCAKRNLTTAITTLNHLHMLMGGVDTLKVLTGKRQYREIVMPLQGIIKVMKNFHNYAVIPQIKKLADEVQKIQNALSQQITQDFNEALTGMNAKNFTPTRNLAEACLVIDILDPKVKCELLKWFVGVQLGEYQVLFGESEDNAWLDKIDQRYIWFKKHLLQCEDKFGAMFPPHWDVSERITVEFCLVTKAELTKIMAKRLKEIDVKLLLYAIQKTHSLEQLFADRFTGNTILEKSKASVTSSKPYEQKPVKHKVILNSSSGNLFVDEQVGETEAVNSVVGGTPSLFNGIIGECFLPYLYIYIESLDRNLYELIEKFTIESKRDLNYGQPVSASLCGVLPSSADLFVFYKKCLVQCNQLNNGPPMLSLSDTFKKYLREYAIKILQNNLPKSGGTSSSSFLSASVASITWDLRDISSASSIIQNFLREGEVAQLSKSEVARICCILTTAEYCLETTQQLEEKLQEKVDPCLVDNINLSQEQDIFYSVISNCVQLLVQDLEMACEPALSAMTKIQWHTKESVEDQSSYVTVITSLLKASVPFIKDCLFSSRKYFTQFCIRFANSFILKFIQSLYKCKPLSVVGAEQLLLDTHMLKTVLLELPSFGSQVARKAPASYTKVVAEGMTRGEMILKVVMAPIESEVSFVDQFLKLLPESDIQEFQKVLEMKGF